MAESNKVEGTSNNQIKPIKEDWYQTEAQVVLVLLVKNIDPASFNIDFKEDAIFIKFPYQETDYIRDFCLSHNINPSKSSFKVYSTKIEINMAKADGTHWSKLEKEAKKEVKQIQSRNWDRVVAEIEDDQPEGEAALSALFQKIYNEGSDEVKKAMNKSFLESGGTELNTNWDSVKKDKVSIKPPEGMEWKTWDK